MNTTDKTDRWDARTRLLIGDEGCERLSRASVLIAGIGGVGGYVAETLARSGIGELTLVDADTVSASNINRQIIALRTTLYSRHKSRMPSTARAQIPHTGRRRPVTGISPFQLRSRLHRHRGIKSRAAGTGIAHAHPGNFIYGGRRTHRPDTHHVCRPMGDPAGRSGTRRARLIQTPRLSPVHTRGL